MKNFIFAFTFVLLTSNSYAAVKVLCSGKHMGKSVVLNGSVESVTDIKTGKGNVTVDGREVTEFYGSDAKINYIFLSLKVQNAHGELLEGKVVDLTTGNGLITRLSIPGYGIDYKNIKVTCAEVKK